MNLVLSPLSKTWIFDIDGTLVEHNGYKTGKDKLLPGVKEFFDKIPSEDAIILITSREKEAKEKTVAFLEEAKLRYDKIIFELPMGERILVNDDKPSGLHTSFAVQLKRNQGLSDFSFTVDETL